MSMHRIECCHIIYVIDTVSGLPCVKCVMPIKVNKMANCLIFFSSLAYRLKKCPHPPTVEQAEILFEDQDYEIGMKSCPLIQEYQSHDVIFFF